MPPLRTSTPTTYAVVEAACERLIPARRRPSRARPRSASPTTSTGCSARSSSTRRASGPAGRSPAGTAARPSFGRFLPLSPARGAGVAHPHRGLAGHRRARVQRPGRRLAGAATATASPRSAPTSPTLDRPRSRTPARRRCPSSSSSLYEHACEGAYGAPEYGGNRDGRGLAVRSSSPATCSRAATPTTR